MTFYHGKAAVIAVEKAEGKLTKGQRLLVEYEGYATKAYLDTKNIVTTKVGQTGEYAHLSFKDTYAVFRVQVRTYVEDFNALPRCVQDSLVALHYRGDMIGTKWLRHLNDGDFDAAAKELVNHKELQSYLDKGYTADTSPFVKRFTDAVESFKKAGKKGKRLRKPVIGGQSNG